MIRTAIFLLVAVWTGTLHAECPGTEPKTRLGRRFSLGQGLPRNAVFHEITESGSRYLRVRIHVDNLVDSGWVLSVRDKELHVLETFTASDFAVVRDRWTVRVPGDTAVFDLDPKTARVDVSFAEYLAVPAETTEIFYSLQTDNAPAFVPLYKGSDRTGRRLGDVVGFFMASESAGGAEAWTCSAVVVAPTLIMTNWHCGGLTDSHWGARVVRNSIVDLSWDDDTLSREFVVTRKEDADEMLDYAFLRIDPITSLGSLRSVTINERPPIAGQTVRIVHHPAGRQKQISTCTVNEPLVKGWRDDQLSRFTHVCDTESGSSGAPVFNARGDMIGLHHYGFNPDPVTCKPTDRVNKAIRIDKILAHLRAANSPLLSEMSIVSRPHD